MAQRNSIWTCFLFMTKVYMAIDLDPRRMDEFLDLANDAFNGLVFNFYNIKIAIDYCFCMSEIFCVYSFFQSEFWSFSARLREMLEGHDALIQRLDQLFVVPQAAPGADAVVAPGADDVVAPGDYVDYNTLLRPMHV